MTSLRGSTWSKSCQNGLVTQEPYQYRALSSSSAIRLIKVSPEKVNGCIACRIYQFDEKQQTNIKYHALSYQWGDPKATRQIYLQDQGREWRSFPVHENLWRFIDHVWRRQTFDRFFWTDHLCLNQNGHEEISQQVPRMHAIYRNAELALIWLQLDKSEEGALRKVIKSRERSKLMPRFWCKIMQKRLASYQDKIWSVTENPYWGRVWIVQEVVMAKRVCVTSGDISIDLDDLHALVEPFRKATFPLGHPSMWVLCDMRAAGGKMPLWRILRDFTGYQSSRPADRVYGLLGMVADDDDGSSPAANIHVDYDKPVLQVLLDAMFESSPPLTEYRLVTLCLGPPSTYDSLSLLEEYITRSTTTPRQRYFAKHALHAFEAFNIIKSVPGAPHRYDIRDITDDLFASAAETGWKPSCRQSAALIGLLLARWTSKPVAHWKANRERRGQKPSPWQCAAHWSVYRDQVVPAPYEMVTRVTAARSWDRKGVVDACGEQSRFCDGSTITCEIPQIGLRLLVQPAINTAGEGRLSLYRAQSNI
ncbi:hypothetical protein J7T55_001727 [Diaporthe amygdali]|uniref:uncharacterized protein n=1 Tax=Phomopsis amygdali TaxID=1214568 RepID=UPI0022FEF715|nr:uncharacterized protein J7T55_001727 [Diaporthe amygdali]KAJ0104240.1 hypothetical protein J7T55_001727 [Diaporthe amygdali]